jgi:hypothetical protein
MNRHCFHLQQSLFTLAKRKRDMGDEVVIRQISHKQAVRYFVNVYRDFGWFCLHNDLIL